MEIEGVLKIRRETGQMEQVGAEGEVTGTGKGQDGEISEVFGDFRQDFAKFSPYLVQETAGKGREKGRKEINTENVNNGSWSRNPSKSNKTLLFANFGLILHLLAP